MFLKLIKSQLNLPLLWFPGFL